MSENVLESYLVKLGATLDTVSFVKFDSTLRSAGAGVNSFTDTSIKGFVKLETTIIGAFTSAGAAIIALADKTAMADQQFNLMGSRMLMTKGSFRAMQQALDTLGVSLSDIVTDRTGELNSEFQDLYDRNIKLGKSLGPAFDASMVGIRRIRVEFKQFGNELTMLSYGTVSKLYQKLGLGTGDVLADLRKLNDTFTNDLPIWSDKVATGLLPVWNDFTGIMKTVGHDAEAVALAFTNAVGAMTGDTAIESNTLKFENLAKAIDHVANGLADVVQWTSKIAGTVFHGLSASGDTIITGVHKFSAMTLRARADNLRNSGMWNSKARADELDKKADQEEKWASKSWEHANKESNNAYSKYFTGSVEENFGPGYNASKNKNLSTIIAAAAKQYNVDPALIAAIIKQESGGQSSIVNKDSGATGLMQLMPGTATQYGVTDPTDPTQNVNAGTHLYADLLKRHGGDEYGALKDFGGFKTSDPTSYIDSIEKMQQQGEASGGQIIIQSMTINVPKDAHPSEIPGFIKDGFIDFLKHRDGRVTAQVAAGAHF